MEDAQKELSLSTLVQARLSPSTCTRYSTTLYLHVHTISQSMASVQYCGWRAAVAGAHAGSQADFNFWAEYEKAVNN